MNYLLAALVWLCLLPFGAQASQLVALNDKTASHAVVLVGGFGENHAYFEPWKQSLVNEDVAVFGFEHDHRSMSMTDGAQELARELGQLHAAGVRTVTVLAHSMGGLVAKKALHVLAQSGELSRFNHVTLSAYGTPWGGFYWANFARWVPGSGFIATKLGFPMSTEIGSTSAFMRSLQEPLPDNVELVLHVSDADTVATPETAAGAEQFAHVLARANEVVRHTGLGHSDFVYRLQPMLLAKAY